MNVEFILLKIEKKRNLHYDFRMAMVLFIHVIFDIHPACQQVRIINAIIELSAHFNRASINSS